MIAGVEKALAVVRSETARVAGARLMGGKMTEEDVEAVRAWKGKGGCRERLGGLLRYYCRDAA